MLEFLIGFVVAIIIALTGVGASVVTAPLLILFLKIPVDIAVSTTLAYSAIVKFIVVPFQVVRRQIDYRVLGIMLAGGVPGVVFGSVAFKRVATNGPKAALSFALGAIIFFTAAWHLYRHFYPAALERHDNSARSKWLLALITLPIGAEIGFSSAGAGALGTVALLGLTSLTATQVVGTDLAFGLVIAVVGSGVHLIGGHYNAALLIKLAIGGVVGGLIGSGVAPKIPNRNLRFVLSLWLLVIGIQFCYTAIMK
jgi:uncharacterized membrane protein YfcA